MRLGYTWTGLVAGLAMLCGVASAEAGPITPFGGFGSGDPGTPTTAGQSLSFGGSTGFNFVNFDGGDPGSTGEFFVVGAYSNPGAPNDFSFLAGKPGAHDFSYAGLGGLGYGPTTSASFETLFSGKNPFDVYDVWSSGHDGSLLQYGGSGFFTWAGFDGGAGSFSVPGDHDGPRGTNVAPVPEPGSLLLMGSGALLGLGRLRQRFRRTT